MHKAASDRVEAGHLCPSWVIGRSGKRTNTTPPHPTLLYWLWTGGAARCRDHMGLQALALNFGHLHHQDCGLSVYGLVWASSH